MHSILARFFRWIFRLTPKCYVCQERDGKELSSTPRHGIYGDEGMDPHYFHEECVYATLDDPEFYGHSTVDRALWIFDECIEQAREQEKKLSRRKERIEEIKNAEFWGRLSQ